MKVRFEAREQIEIGAGRTSWHVWDAVEDQAVAWTGYDLAGSVTPASEWDAKSSAHALAWWLNKDDPDTDLRKWGIGGDESTHLLDKIDALECMFPDVTLVGVYQAILGDRVWLSLQMREDMEDARARLSRPTEEAWVEEAG